MGFFAVLAPECAAAPDDQRYVERCHLNLWSLPGLMPGRRLLYLDVGLDVRAGVEELDSLQILLPFRLEEGAWPGASSSSSVLQDLHDPITEQPTAELVFGGPVSVRQTSGEHVLEVGDYEGPTRLARVIPTSAKVVKAAQRADSTLVDLVLQDAIQPAKSAYLRVRFRVFGSAPLWRWTRATGGARVDLRICDVRESRFAGTEQHLRGRILDIRQANVFVMTHPRLELRARSPELKYLRPLEPGVWRSYLRGASYRFGGGDLLVYYWQYLPRPRPDEERRSINADNPFRVFLDLHRPAGRPTWYALVLAALGALLALLLVRLGRDFDAVSWLGDIDLLKLGQIVVGTSLIGVVTFFGWLREWGMDRFRKPRTVVRQVERMLLGVGRK